jgi:hypothetical protein
VQPALQRISRRASRTPQFAHAETTTGGVERIRAVQSKSAGFVESGWDKMGNRTGSVELPPDPWSRGERRLWFVAGSLMALAVAVLTAFALVTFGGVHMTTSALAAPASGAPEPTAPSMAAAAPAHDGNTFRPMLPARVRAEAPKTTVAKSAVARKHVKQHHKGKRAARD